MEEAMTDTVTVDITVASRLIRMSGTLDMRDQLAEDDALSSLLGRMVLAKARQKLQEMTEAEAAKTRHDDTIRTVTYDVTDVTPDVSP
jgi:hypothetical protein